MNQPITILLIEDNPADARLTLEAFRTSALGTKVEVREDGESALSYLRAADTTLPKLILLDLNLPGIDGREVLQEIKTDDRLRAIPVCVLTTSRAEEDILQAYYDHTNCYIVKPVDLKNFRSVIEQVETFWFQLAKVPQHLGETRST